MLQFHAIKEHTHMQGHDVNTEVRKHTNKRIC
jgi:hypothetical protein